MISLAPPSLSNVPSGSSPATSPKSLPSRGQSLVPEHKHTPPPSSWFAFCGARAPLLAAYLLAATSSGQAQSVLWSNPINDTDPSLFNPYTNGQVVAPNLTVSGIGRGPGIIASPNAANKYDAKEWSTAETLDPNDYFYWTLTPNSGYKLDFTSFTYNTQGGGQGPDAFALRSSRDNYTANLATPPSTGGVQSLTAATFLNGTSPVTFRLYGWSAGDLAGSFGVTDFVFNGAVNAIGGPAIYLDVNGSAAGSALTTGSTYDFSPTYWSLDPNGAAATTAFTNGSMATFSAGTDGAGKTITVNIDAGAVVSSNGLSFEEGNVTLAAGAGTLTLTGANVNVSAGATATITEPLLGSVGLNKIGDGLLVLRGTQTYTGATTVSNGTLQVGVTGAASIAGSPVTVNSGTLAGTGTVGATTVNSGASLSPGDAAGAAMGLLNVAGNLALNAGSISAFQLLNSAIGNYDQVASTGTVTVNPSAMLSLSFQTGFTASIGQAFKLLDAASGTISNFSGAANGTVFNTTIGGTPYSFEYVYDGSSINGLFASSDTSALFLVVVPEPSRPLFLLAGASGLMMRRKRR